MVVFGQRKLKVERLPGAKSKERKLIKRLTWLETLAQMFVRTKYLATMVHWRLPGGVTIEKDSFLLYNLTML